MKIYNLILLILFPVLLNAQNREENDKVIEKLQSMSAKLIGLPIPLIEAYSTNKKLYSTDSLKNKVTLINLWFEACTPCIAEMGALNDLYEKYKSNADFRFLAFTFEKKEDIERIKKKFNIEYTQIPVSKEYCYTLNFMGGFPTTIISDKNGNVAYYNGGGHTDPEKSKAYFIDKVHPVLDSLLKKED